MINIGLYAAEVGPDQQEWLPLPSAASLEVVQTNRQRSGSLQVIVERDIREMNRTGGHATHIFKQQIQESLRESPIRIGLDKLKLAFKFLPQRGVIRRRLIGFEAFRKRSFFRQSHGLDRKAGARVRGLFPIRTNNRLQDRHHPLPLERVPCRIAFIRTILERILRTPVHTGRKAIRLLNQAAPLR